MIISASRRTDIPAFYSEWFMNRIREGFCLVPNPFNPEQIGRVSLLPEDVDAIWFWTRNPRPLFRYLNELDNRGFRYFFLITLMDNPSLLDPGMPPVQSRIEAFRELSNRIGQSRLTWRYDPIVLSSMTGIEFHASTYQAISSKLKGFTEKCVISFLDIYRKFRKRLEHVSEKGLQIHSDEDDSNVEPLMTQLAKIASQNRMEIRACAEERDFSQYGILPGKCIDESMIERVWGTHLEIAKDPSQRKACGCAASKDIGMYETCISGCMYCYAVTNFDRARMNYKSHDPSMPSMILKSSVTPNPQPLETGEGALPLSSGFIGV